MKFTKVNPRLSIPEIGKNWKTFWAKKCKNGSMYIEVKAKLASHLRFFMKKITKKRSKMTKNFNLIRKFMKSCKLTSKKVIRY